MSQLIGSSQRLLQIMHLTFTLKLDVIRMDEVVGAEDLSHGL